MIEQSISYTDMVRRMTKKRIGDLLLDHKIITEGQLEEALDLQRQGGGYLGEIFIK